MAASHGGQLQVAQLFTMSIVLSVTSWGYGQESKLVYTAILYRHGDRSPISTFPTDKVPISTWYEGLGQLTRLGMRQQYHLGQLFRQRYSTELNARYLFDNYTRTQVHVRSTDHDRTLNSAQCQLASFFKPNEAQRILPGLNWQPIPVHTIPLVADNLLLGFSVDCPVYQDLKANIPQTPEYKNFSAMYKHFFVQLQNWTGEREVNMLNVFRIADTVYIQYVHNLSSYTPWATEEVRSKLYTLSIYSIKWLFDTVEKSRLACGILVNKIVDEMRMKVNGSCKQERMHLFSAHDTTVVCLMSALGVFDMQFPKYSSSVIVELYKKLNSPTHTAMDYYVEVWYKYGPMVERDGKLYCSDNSPQPFNSTADCLDPLLVRGCPSQQCPFEAFINATSVVSPKDWESECGLSSKATNDQWCSFGITMTVVSGVLLLLLIVVSCVCLGALCHSRRKHKKIYSLLEIS